MREARLYTLEDILKPHALEERVYRMRCVEGWSMVIPWVGFPLRDLLARFQPNGNAQFVEFTTILRPDEMIGQRPRFPPVLRWPYREGLRMDEAMHPLTIMAVGLYGETLLPQNGAPIRLVVPWKYGFKSIKSIVKINFVRRQPRTSWEENWPEAYGFYSNVNPDKGSPGPQPGAGAQDRRVLHAADADVQWIRRSGRVDVRRRWICGVSIDEQAVRGIRIVRLKPDTTEASIIAECRGR